MLTVIEHAVLREVCGKGHLWPQAGVDKIARHGVEPYYDLDHTNLDIDALAYRTLKHLQSRGLVMASGGAANDRTKIWRATDLGLQTYFETYPPRFRPTWQNRLRYWVARIGGLRHQRLPSILEWCWSQQATHQRRVFAGVPRWRRCHG